MHPSSQHLWIPEIARMVKINFLILLIGPLVTAASASSIQIDETSSTSSALGQSKDGAFLDGISTEAIKLANISLPVLTETKCMAASMSITAAMCTVVLDQIRRSPRYATQRLWSHGVRDPSVVLPFTVPNNRCAISIVADRTSEISDTFSLQDVHNGAHAVIRQCVRHSRTGYSTLGRNIGFNVIVGPANLAEAALYR